VVLRQYVWKKVMSLRTVLYISSELADADEWSKSFERLGCRFIALRDLSEAVATAFLNRTLDVIVLDQRHGISVSAKLVRLFKVVRPGARLVSLYTETPQVPPDHIDTCLCTAGDLESIADTTSRILQLETVAA